VERSDTIGALAAALAKFQGSVGTIAKTKTVTVKTRTGASFGYAYADLAAILDAIRKPMLGAELSVLQTMNLGEGGLSLETTLAHASGEYVISVLPIPNTGNDPQALGSWLTYARRYSLCSILGISAEDDDDGAHAKAKGKEEPAPKPVPPTPNPAPKPNGEPKPADAATAMKAVHAKANELNIAHEEVSAWACDASGLESMADLTVEQLRETYRALADGRVATWLETHGSEIPF